MSWWNGLSTCWPPGEGDCVVWWDAWAAIGTVGAVICALSLATLDGRRRKKELEGRSRWIAMELLRPIRAWRMDVGVLAQAIELDDFKMMMSITNGQYGKALEMPAGVSQFRADVYQLGVIGEALAQACFLIGEIADDWHSISAFVDGKPFEGEDPQKMLKDALFRSTQAEKLLGTCERAIVKRLNFSRWLFKS
ncbi:hypothetical protein I5U28_03185 [Stenotrophomonas maltophilia]|uniref:hypothetical protein n=1 Tax=Stenotrophomonas geniculata TaxID=86188 RepID=UPI00128B8A65|nr:hypothetical protein [Stenotrophomonas geniculata]MBH1404540.1 hypothetical protein [Stenotrophomonas maltophilia]MDP9619718.1 hypothetical protein [Stenotrophomonas maltophilia]